MSANVKILPSLIEFDESNMDHATLLQLLKPVVLVCLVLIQEARFGYCLLLCRPKGIRQVFNLQGRVAFKRGWIAATLSKIKFQKFQTPLFVKSLSNH